MPARGGPQGTTNKKNVPPVRILTTGNRRDESSLVDTRAITDDYRSVVRFLAAVLYDASLPGLVDDMTAAENSCCKCWGSRLSSCSLA